MAGQIDFALHIDNAQAVAATQQTINAVNAFKGLRISSQDINDAFKRAANEARTKNNELKELGKNTQAAQRSMAALTNTLTIFGGSVAPQVTAGILTVTTGLQAMRATAEATKLSLASVGVAGLGVVGIFATLSAAVDFARAKLDEAATESSTREGLLNMAGRLRSQIQDLYAQGKLGKEEAIGLQIGLDKNTVEELYAAVRRVQQRLKELLPAKIDLKALDNLNMYERSVKAMTMSGKDRALYEMETQVVEISDRFRELAKAAGQDPAQYGDVVNAFAAQRRREIEEQFAPKAEAGGARSRFDASGRLTGLERMGLVITSGVSGSFDPARTTAENTRQMLNEQRKTNTILTNGGSQSFARI